MKKLSLISAVVASSAIVFALTPRPAAAGGWLSGLFGSSSVDVHAYECGECGLSHDPGVECIKRIPVTDCVKGKKKVYNCKVKYQCVSIPEIRYRWKTKYVTRKIPACYCKPVCRTQDGENCYGEERWDKYCEGCGEVHCKSIECKTEKAPCKYCDSEQGQTTITVRYKTCVKEEYTVYRQISIPVCVKQPRYEKVEVPITRHECEHYDCDCNGGGCQQCCGG